MHTQIELSCLLNVYLYLCVFTIFHIKTSQLNIKNSRFDWHPDTSFVDQGNRMIALRGPVEARNNQVPYTW